MMKFLLQTVDGLIRHDFVLECLNSIEYLNWKEVGSADYKFCELKDIQDGLIDGVEDYTPVGTIEFVYAFIDKFIKPDGSKLIKPINVPKELMIRRFTGRLMDNISIDENSGISQDVLNRYRNEVFVKSNDIIKSPVSRIYKIDDIVSWLKPGNYQLSSLIDIDTEYRCFVYNDELRGIQYYSGDFRKCLDMGKIDRMLEVYKWKGGLGPAPQAYTLDVGVTESGETVIIEVHEFFSCGLYGFSDYLRLGYMFKRTFDKIKQRLLG